jgi:arabinofuranan 3-O-arabinosyltransferase
VAGVGSRGSMLSRKLSPPGRVLHVLVVTSVLVVNLVQRPGQITFDSKLDLQLSPVAFMVRSMSLWNPDAAFGELQNQASGFLFPIGSFYTLGSLAGVPIWVWERFWSAAVMLLAYEGARRLARSWADLGVVPAVVAGLSYALAPRVLTTVGGLTGETLPTSVLPWTVLPLILLARGRMGRWTALVASAATVPFMGGQNATEVIATFTLPFLVICFGSPSWRGRLCSVVGWGVLVVVACLWWLVPLVVLGKYSPPFLDFIESARTTTDPIGWLSALRGTDHWVAFLPSGSTSGWVAGYDLVSSPWLLLSTTAVSAAGLVGLVVSQVPLKRALVFSLLIGFFALTAGSGGLAASPIGGAWVEALDGTLAPFRNIHKFDPLVRLPLSLGVGFLVAQLMRGRTRPSRAVGRMNLDGILPRAALVLVALALLVSAAPAFAGNLRDADGFQDIPHAWRQASGYLDGLPATTRVMVLPGAGFGIQSWGRTVDTPLQVLDPPPWVVRSQTPLSPPDTVAFQDSIENLLTDGRPSPGLGRLLDRAGITDVLVRNDLNPDMTDAPDPTVVHNVLDHSPGLSRVRAYGSAGNGYPLIEIYRVHSTTADPRVRLLNWQDRAIVQGGAGNVASLVEAGLLPLRRPAVTVRNPGDRQPVDAVTDTQQRHERNFGRVHEAVSDVMTGADRFRLQRAAHDYSVDDSSSGLTVAKYRGIADVTASTSAGYADTFGPVVPDDAPYAAIDGSLLTDWVSSPFTESRGQWLQLRFVRPTTLGPISLQFNVRAGARIQRVRVETAGGAVQAAVNSTGGVRSLQLPVAPTKVLRLVVTGVRGDASRPVRLTDLSIQGLHVRRALVLPGAVSTGTTVLLTSAVPPRACFHGSRDLTCGSGGAGISTEAPGFERVLRVVGAGRWQLSGTAVATGGPSVAALFAPLSRRLVTVVGSSFFAGDPGVIPANAFDGDPLTSWLAAPGDADPVLDLSWQGKRTITRIRPSLLPGQPGRLPTRIKVASDQGVQVVDVGGNGLAVMRPVRTHRLRLTMLTDPASSAAGPIGVAELTIDGLDDVRYQPEPNTPTGTACGFGPTLEVAGQQLDTRLAGTLSDVLTGAPLRVVACGNAVRLPAGTDDLRLRNVAGFAATSLALVPSIRRGTREHPAGTLKVEAWNATRRTVHVKASSKSVLVVPQSFNDGWVASLDGGRLAPTVVDGWKQGWRVPAGTNGLVRMSYRPEPLYLVSILGGLGVALCMMIVALFLLRRHGRGSRQPAPATGRGSPESRVRRHTLIGLPLLALTCAVVSIPLLVGMVVGVALVRFRTRVYVCGALCLLALAAVVAAAGLDKRLVAPTLSDVVVAGAVGLVLGGVWVRPGEEGRTQR